MRGFATMKASGRQEFVIQTKANDTLLLLHTSYIAASYPLDGQYWPRNKNQLFIEESLHKISIIINQCTNENLVYFGTRKIERKKGFDIIDHPCGTQDVLSFWVYDELRLLAWCPTMSGKYVTDASYPTYLYMSWLVTESWDWNTLHSGPEQPRM